MTALALLGERIELPATASGLLEGISRALDGMDVLFLGSASDTAWAHEQARGIARAVGFVDVPPPRGDFAAFIIRGSYARVSFRVKGDRDET